MSASQEVSNGTSGAYHVTSSSKETYTPPIERVLGALRISHTDLSKSTATVSVDGLRQLIARIVQNVSVDESWYIERYPDVRAAIISGDTPSASAHFKAAGYFEGRLPHSLSFDPEFYFQKYSDLSMSFSAQNVLALKHHYESKGFSEGRAGIPSHFEEAESWRIASIY